MSNLVLKPVDGVELAIFVGRVEVLPIEDLSDH